MNYVIGYLLGGMLLSLGLHALYTFNPKSKQEWERAFGERTVPAFVILYIVITLCWLPALLWAGFLSHIKWRKNGKRS